MAVEPDISDALAELPWSTRSRLEFIEFRLGWYGKLVRNDLRKHFGISAPQASTDVERYESIAPGNLRYDTAQKAFLRGTEFKRRLTGGQADRRLLQMLALSRGWFDLKQSWFDDLPEVEVLQLRRRSISDDLLSTLLDAVRGGLSVRARYWTMSGKPADERRIAPHAFGYSSGRWHVRAYDEGNGDFRDFNLGRLEDAVLAEPSQVSLSLDYEWKTSANLRIIANPGLSEEMQAATRREFCFVGDRLEVPCRLAMLFYMRSEFGLEDHQLPAGRRPLLLENANELESMRLGARQLSANAIANLNSSGTP